MFVAAVIAKAIIKLVETLARTALPLPYPTLPPARRSGEPWLLACNNDKEPASCLNARWGRGREVSYSADARSTYIVNIHPDIAWGLNRTPSAGSRTGSDPADRRIQIVGFGRWGGGACLQRRTHVGGRGCNPLPWDLKKYSQQGRWHEVLFGGGLMGSGHSNPSTPKI